MKLFIILSLFFIIKSYAVCPDGFSPFNSKTCVKYYSEHSTYYAAQTTCAALGANLISIHNAIDNRVLTNLAANYSSFNNIWLGLFCQYSSPKACIWADGSGDTGDYSNFAPGNPKVDGGSSNIVLLPCGAHVGQWFSVEPYNKAPYFCSIEMAEPGPKCDAELNGKCYFPVTSAPLAFNDAHIYCEKEQCGELVSIHSVQENEYILSLFQNLSLSNNYIHLGASLVELKNNTLWKRWLDGSSWDFDNSGYYDTQIGNYLSMALKDDIIPRGKWISSSYLEKLPFVCKRDKNVTCSHVTTTTSAPTMAPLQCGPQFLKGTGTIYSPNYPYSYLGAEKNCTYLITVAQENLAQIQFVVLNLDPKSSISLYSAVEETVPIVVLRGKATNSPTYLSPTNVMKVVFQRCSSGCDNDGSANYNWKANYQFY